MKVYIEIEIDDIEDNDLDMQNAIMSIIDNYCMDELYEEIYKFLAHVDQEDANENYH